MFAIIKIAGNQFKVREGDIITIPHLNSDSKKIEIKEVLLLADKDDVKVGKPVLEKAVVKAEMVEDTVKGPKKIAFKYKKRKGYRKKTGYRTLFSKIKITKISA